MRSFLFNVAYWVTSILTVLIALPLLLIPHRGPLMWWILQYTRMMCFWMNRIGGIDMQVVGKEHLPEGPCIIAAKHQSWGDGFFMFSQFYDLAFVVGDHMEKFPLVGGILRKMGSVIVNNCGGAEARATMMDSAMEKARQENRRILIYPEGHLSAIGEKHRYRKGVYHMYAEYKVAVVPVATNLGECWPQNRGKIKPGRATLEFLPPILPGMEKDAFMQQLEEVIEKRSYDLLSDQARARFTLSTIDAEKTAEKTAVPLGNRDNTGQADISRSIQEPL